MVEITGDFDHGIAQEWNKGRIASNVSFSVLSEMLHSKTSGVDRRDGMSKLVEIFREFVLESWHSLD